MRYRAVCPAELRNRQTQVLSGEPQLLLLHQPGPAAFVLGEQGKRATLQVRLGDPHTCSCRQHALERELCDHLCWVLLRYLRLRPEQPITFQLGISANDLDKLLAKTRGRGELDPGPAVAAATGSTPTPLDYLGEVKLSRRPHDDDCCPVCLEGLLSAGQPVTYCRLGCGGCVHIACMLRVAKHAVGSLTPSNETIAGFVTCPLCRGDFATLGALLEENQNSPSSNCRIITKVPVKQTLPALASLPILTEKVSTDCHCSVCGGSAKLRCALCSSVRFCGTCATLPDSLHVGHGLLFLRRSTSTLNWVQSLPNTAGNMRGSGDQHVQAISFLEKTSSKLKTSASSSNKTTSSWASVSTSVVVKEGHRLLRRGQQCLLCLQPFQDAIIVPSLCQNNPPWLGLKEVAGCGSCAGVSAVLLTPPPQVKASRAVLADRSAISIRKRRRVALEAASVAAAVAAAASAPLLTPSTSETNSATSTPTGSSSTPSLPSLPTPPPSVNQPPNTSATIENAAKPSAAGEAIPAKQLEQLQQLKPLLAALMANEDPVLAMPLPLPPPPPPLWRHANGVHACPALRLALRLGRVPDASSPTTPTASCALCGEVLPAPTTASSPTLLAEETRKETPPSATLPSPQEGATAAAATTSPRLAITSITMPDVVAHHLAHPQRTHQRRVRHLQRRRRTNTTFEGQSPKQSNRPRPKTASGIKQSDGGVSSTRSTSSTKVQLNQSDSDGHDGEDVSLAARLRAMRLAAAGGDVDPGLPPPPWASSSTGCSCSHSECDCGESRSSSGQATPMPTIGLRGLKLEPIKKPSTEEVERAADPPTPPFKLRRYLLREKLAKQRPRTTAAAAATAAGTSLGATSAALNARVTMFSLSVDPVTMMGWVPPRMLTRPEIGGVRASCPLLRTSNSTEASY